MQSKVIGQLRVFTDRKWRSGWAFIRGAANLTSADCRLPKPKRPSGPPPSPLKQDPSNVCRWDRWREWTDVNATPAFFGATIIWLPALHVKIGHTMDCFMVWVKLLVRESCYTCATKVDVLVIPQNHSIALTSTPFAQCTVGMKM